MTSVAKFFHFHKHTNSVQLFHKIIKRSSQINVSEYFSSSDFVQIFPTKASFTNARNWGFNRLVSATPISQNTHFRLRLANDHAVQANGQALLNLQILQRHLNLRHHRLHVAASELRVAGLVRKPPFHRNVARHRRLAGLVLSDDRVTSGILRERLGDHQTRSSGVGLRLKPERIPLRHEKSVNDFDFNSSFSPRGRVALFRIRRVHARAKNIAARSPRLARGRPWEREATRKRLTFSLKIMR